MRPLATTTEPFGDRVRGALGAATSPASLAAHRMLFGALVAVSSVRFLAEGWVERAYVRPTFFFHYFGFEWVRVLPPQWMVGAYVALAALGVLVMLGLFHRVAATLLFLLFTYVELIDVTNYLNHYYLVSLLALLHAVLPSNAAYSLDARFFGAGRDTVPAYALYLLRFQVAVVYFYAALAKVGPDWLLHGQPLELWMASRGDLPVVGPLVTLPYAALVMSWAGFLNDLLAVPLLLARRTRGFAFAMVFTFHGLTGVFFNIGIFPYLMMINATLWLAPDWPARVRPPTEHLARNAAPYAVSRGALAALATYAALQGLVPLRSHLYGGNVLWHEQGMRWSWRVMLRQKTGDVVYRVRSPEGHTTLAFPHTYLTSQQEREMAGQPDLILQLAHHIAETSSRGGRGRVEVRVDAWVALNGRAPARLIDPDVDLASVRDGFAPSPWITRAPPGPPVHFRSRSALLGASGREESRGVAP